MTLAYQKTKQKLKNLKGKSDYEFSHREKEHIDTEVLNHIVDENIRNLLISFITKIKQFINELSNFYGR